MELYFGGGERAEWSSFLADQRVTTMTFSWYGLKKRRNNLRDYRISANVPEGSKIFLDSGCFAINKDDTIDQDAAYELCQEYLDFVDRNINDIAFASEFDATVLGDMIYDIRTNYWDNLDPQKWMPVWHSDTGIQELRRLSGQYERVGILQTAGDSSEILPHLRALSSGTSFHGISMTKIDAMKTLPLSSVSSTSWLSPTQFGDTFVWDGNELHRYPRDYKHRRETHRHYLGQQGFDTAKIEADDRSELLKLSVWSWQRFVDSIPPLRGVTSSVLDPFNQIQETAPNGVAISTPEVGNAVAVRGEKIPLPMLASTTETTYDPDGTEVQTRILRSPGVNLLQCNTCHISQLCPKYQADEECAYEIPVEIRTSTQLDALQDTLVEMQTQRVLRATMFEQVQGGAIDKGTSEEYDRLQRMITKKVENKTDKLNISIQAQSNSGGPGMISRIFGSSVEERVNAIPAIESGSIMEAEIVE